MIFDNEPSDRFLATVQSGGTEVQDVPVMAFLPRRATDPLRLVLCPQCEQVSALRDFFEFSLVAEVRGFNGDVETVFRANRVFAKSLTTRGWGLDLQETYMEAVPYDMLKLSVRDHLVPNGNVSGHFLLTPCFLLKPFQAIESSYTGSVKVETLNQRQFVLHNGVQLRFDSIFRHFTEANKDHVSFSELAATFDDSSLIGSTSGIPEICLPELDDFLLITSFAARQRCVCIGWEATDAKGHVTFYRRDVVIPDSNPDWGHNDTLIEVRNFDDFLTTAYSHFMEIPSKKYIRQALHAVIADESPLELRLTRLFSALETLVLSFRRDKSAEFILSQEDWRAAERKLRKAIQAIPQFGGEENKPKRCRVYENVTGLNRISFSSAFKEFCEHNQITLDDLWPVCGPHETVNLTEIRNQIVHGEALDHAQLNTVITATSHLEWILERVILSIFGWDRKKSRVAPNALARMTHYSNWQDATL